MQFKNFIKKLKFNKDGLIPTIIQDEKTKKVLMMAYMSKESLKKTLKEGKTCFWSRSRRKLWTKGETSKNFQYIKNVYTDCDQDCLLILVEQIGVACHTGERSCFFEKFEDEPSPK